jgi:hypothetical protein
VSWADHNLVGDAHGPGGYSGISPFKGNTVILKANPLLGPLQNNGRPTQTMALLVDSPAIGHASNALGPATDQRGVKRFDVAGEMTDIGAYEL